MSIRQDRQKWERAIARARKAVEVLEEAEDELNCIREYYAEHPEESAALSACMTQSWTENFYLPGGIKEAFDLAAAVTWPKDAQPQITTAKAHRERERAKGGEALRKAFDVLLPKEKQRPARQNR